MQLKRKILSVGINAELMNLFPENIRQALKALEGKGVAIKGGFARYCFIEYLKGIGKFTDMVRYEIEKKVIDLDIVLLRRDSWEREKDLLIARGEALQAELAKLGLIIEAKDAEIAKGRHFDFKTIRNILATRDLTINEVLLVWENGQWVIQYTPQCYHDIIDGVGYINPKPGHARVYRGVWFPSPRGLARAIKFLASGKIYKIVFPEVCRQFFFEEFERRVKAENLPAGVRQQYEPMEFFGLVLFKIYCTVPEIQNRAMQIMVDLGLTDGMLSVAAYVREQELLSKLHGTPFEMEEQTWGKVVQKQIDNNKNVVVGQQARKEQRGACKHEMVNYVCQGCDFHCPMKVCGKCTLSIFNPPLPCAMDLENGRMPHMKNIFYEPPLPRMEVAKLMD
jgi:hypothetical protein